MERLRTVYPHLDEGKLKLKTSAELLNDANVHDILGADVHLCSPDIAAFSEDIISYITATKSRKGPSGRNFCQWPLVKLVNIYVKSDLLLDGLGLVDLPGSMDVSATRSAIAEDYMKNLSAFCVVAPVRRAAANKTAHAALSDAVQRDMKLDG